MSSEKMDYREIHRHLHDPANRLPKEIYEQVKLVTEEANIRLRLSAILESQRHLHGIGAIDSKLSVIEEKLFAEERINRMKTRDLTTLYAILSRRHDTSRDSFIKMTTDTKVGDRLEVPVDDLDRLVEEQEEVVISIDAVDPKKAEELVDRIGNLTEFLGQRKAGLVTAPPIVV